jgi:DNA topoisomerase-1
MSSKNLVIVESPGKIKTISKFLGADFTVMASMGHVRDLPKNKMGIDIEHGFVPQYIVPKDKSKTIKGLQAKIKKDTIVWIATDEDREGEAIGWHLVEALKLSDRKDLKRIVFHEITKPAILEAVANPRTLDMNKVNAQQTRRVLDRLVGYELSPLIWKKIRYGLSAGRVQSVALRLIVEREREIQAFVPEEYWNVIGQFLTEDKEKFEARLAKFKGKPIKVTSEEQSKEILAALKEGQYTVANVETKEQKRNPAPPFTTSTLQQEGARKLGFSVKKTMSVAQKLYEGVELPSGHEGLITYMRTDSVNLSNLALAQAKEVISSMYGNEYALDTPRFYKGKKGAQEAHEAIRPTDLTRTPDSVKAYMDKDEARLYELIWKRTLACQMAEALLDMMGADIESNGYSFRATGQVLKFPGFLKVYKEDLDEPEDEEGGDAMLPAMKAGDHPALKSMVPTQHFTKPPARYTEASLVKKLEAEGIGRPSTYAPTISTIQQRGYVIREKKQLIPEEVGCVVNDFLVEHFPKIVDYKFTARMEDMLDEIQDGKMAWEKELETFYFPFHELVEEKMKSVNKDDIVQETTEEICEKCEKPMQVKFGRFGKFLSCTGFPDCKNAKPLDGKGAKAEPTEEELKALEELAEKYAGKICPKCQSPMIVKTGRFGTYLACEKYPTCKSTEAILTSLGIKCSECGEGELVERRARKSGKVFYGCNRFPKCKFATWDKPAELDS